jgi:hypothetical protein
MGAGVLKFPRRDVFAIGLDMVLECACLLGSTAMHNLPGVVAAGIKLHGRLWRTRGELFI